MRTVSITLFFIICAVLTLNDFEKRPDVIEPIVVTATYMPDLEPDPDPISKEELMCLAKNIYHEARSETTNGMLAVAHVTINRVNSSKFPNRKFRYD